jgi:hypothetical protein
MTVKEVFTRLPFGVMIRIVEEYGKNYFKRILKSCIGETGLSRK